MLLGESENVSQEEYDVTAYRNVLDQLKTIDGELDRARGILRGDLGSTLVSHGRGTGTAQTGDYKEKKKLSGFMMQVKGGKDTERWAKVVSKAIGVSGVRNHQREKWNVDGMKKWIEKVSGAGPVEKERNCSTHPQTLQPHQCTTNIKPLPYRNKVYNYVSDIHNLIRNVQWELNRLRIEMPFDLRQLTDQLSQWSMRVRSDAWADAAIVEWKIFNKVEELRKSIIPKMKERIRKKIEEAELAEKVDEESQRKENQATLTRAERMEKEENDAMKKLREKGVKASRSENKFVLSFDDGSSWTKINRDQLLSMAKLPKNLIRQKATSQPQETQPEPSSGDGDSSGGGGMTEADVELRDWAHEYQKQYEQRETQKENDEAVKDAAKKEGDTTGGNNGAVAAAAGLALLAVLGQG